MARGRPAAKTTKKPRKSKSKRPDTLSEETWAQLKSFGSFIGTSTSHFDAGSICLTKFDSILFFGFSQFTLNSSTRLSNNLSLTVPDPETEGLTHKFNRDDIVAILPNGREPGVEFAESEYWIGKIKDIRAEEHVEDGSNTVWARVQWYYSGKDVGDVIKSFDQSAIGRFERIFSDHFDLVGPESFEVIVPMIKFNENDHEQAFISRDQFFRRYTFEYKARTLKPKPGTSSCNCLKPYNPDDMDPIRVMHFCPRPSCRKAYHQSCLIKAKSKESSSTAAVASTSSSPQKPVRATRSARKHASPVKKAPVRPKKEEADTSFPAESRALRLLACSPDTDESIDLESLIPLTVAVVHVVPQDEDDSDTAAAQPPKKKRRGRPSSGKKAAPRASGSQSQNQIEEPRSLASILEEIPSDLLTVAQQPLVRGGAFVQGGVSGNIGFVTRARRLVYQILEGNRDAADDWEKGIFGEDETAGMENALVKLVGSRKPLPPVVCPNCKSAI
ncbi:hypothetical protein GALMADRAFT_246612 [Galerina marginata CBS 339.88]|uniref:BAH domain-containing protein n=1 Tax=Galerina marginata (strain CBS 339.88) TaxID=685588 RepID=A0A067T4K6_GALM3|nr:hypothetical protein GALMADRAFT_246612 [Galerina marginata CBS 339.88]